MTKTQGIFGLLNYDITKVKPSDPWALEFMAARFGGDKDSARKYLVGLKGDYISRPVASEMPKTLLGLGWLRAGSASSYSGDYGRIDEITEYAQKNLTHPSDVWLPPLKIESTEEVEKLRRWVKVAQQKFFDEVVQSIRNEIDSLWDRLEDNKLGILDVTDKIVGRVDNAKARIKKVRLALVSFRLDNEFKDFIDAREKMIDAAKDDLLARMIKSGKELEVAKIDSSSMVQKVD